MTGFLYSPMWVSSPLCLLLAQENCFWDWIKWFLIINQLSDSSTLQNLSPWDSSKKILEEVKASFYEACDCVLLAAMLSRCTILNFTVSCSLQLRLPPIISLQQGLHCLLYKVEERILLPTLGSSTPCLFFPPYSMVFSLFWRFWWLIAGIFSCNFISRSTISCRVSKKYFLLQLNVQFCRFLLVLRKSS